MTRMKYPLNLYVVWHGESKIGQRIAEDLYSSFCRDYSQPLSRGLGIPVYFRNIKLEDDKPLSIDTSEANKNAIVLLVDEEYFLDSGYNDYTEDLIKLVSADTRIFPVALFNKAYELGCGLSRFQFIRGTEFRKSPLNLSLKEDLELSIKKIRAEVLHDCARLLMDLKPSYADEERDRIGSPVKLFLSHAKLDGEKTALRFKTFIQEHLKLDVFFDTVDIADGYDFSRQFEQEISHSALVVFRTDEYSAREWCRREVLIAKRQKSPIVVLDLLRDGEKRAFPYLGNMPTTTLLEDETLGFHRVISLTLYQVLTNLYQLRLLNSYKDLSSETDADFSVLSSPPELFNFLEFNKTKQPDRKLVVLYPDPPLGIEELMVLNELDATISFVTPINI